jgi:hypothetical protein
MCDTIIAIVLLVFLFKLLFDQRARHQDDEPAITEAAVNDIVITTAIEYAADEYNLPGLSYEEPRAEEENNNDVDDPYDDDIEDFYFMKDQF